MIVRPQGHSMPVREPDGSILWHGFVQDITARKEAEAELQRGRDRLQRANAELIKAARLKDEFLANMSHELRTPLTGILLLTEALQRQACGPMPDAALPRLQMIYDSGRHLQTLINDLLDMARVEAGQMVLAPEPCRLAEVGQTSLNLVKGMAVEKAQPLEFALAPPDLVIEADRRRLKQILVNLLSNAVKFTPNGGRIGLEIAGDPAAGVVRLTVWDTGIGIAEDDLPRLFQTFVQLDNRLERLHEGTGIGLVLVRRLAELHGGQMSVESTPGQGSRFTLTLPWTPPAPAVAATGEAPGKRSEPAPSTAPALILLVEDNELNRRAFTQCLEANGYSVVEAVEGLEAVEKARALKPALVLMDIQMPRLNGLEAIRRLRVDPDPVVAEAPIIALTALGMPGDRKRCLAAGANDYLGKPVGFGDLLASIQNWLPRS